MRKFKRMMTVACGICLAGAAAVPAWAGQWMDGGSGRWYRNEDGTYPANDWMQIDGSWYHFDADGYMQTGMLYLGPLPYWLGSDGAMAENTTKMIDGTVYSINGRGICTPIRDFSGWLEDEKGWWYRDSDGSYPISAWRQVNGTWYHFDADGYMQTGWLRDGEDVYWLNPDGAMACDEKLTIDGVEYSFDLSGARGVFYKEPVVILPDSEKSETQIEADQMADQILSGITDEGMTKREKAVAIYSWIRRNIRYVNQETPRDWVAAAYDGLSRRRGDCYTYYSVSVELLSRVGIPSIEVIRSTDHNHYWNLINCGDGWYHYDTTPRTGEGEFCLLTDAQIGAYSAAHHRSHEFDHSLYPPTP